MSVADFIQLHIVLSSPNMLTTYSSLQSECLNLPTLHHDPVDFSRSARRWRLAV